VELTRGKREPDGLRSFLPGRTFYCGVHCFFFWGSVILAVMDRDLRTSVMTPQGSLIQICSWTEIGLKYRIKIYNIFLFYKIYHYF
jgi:hypothetical protein